MELPATQAMVDELPSTQQFVNDEENDDSPVGTLTIGSTSHTIFPGITSIGRHPGCKIHIDNLTVSQKHAQIEATGVNRVLFLKDLGATNNTKLNDTRLRPHSNYQIKDGDKLTFGSIDTKFKLFQAVEDSFISCTPQINRKVRPLIPGTPDSMNASSASEGDVSMIPGTQNDVGTCFRQPEAPSTTSTNNDHNSSRVPEFSMDDFENSIYSAETQKLSERKQDENDESIYELETQKPSDLEKDRSTIENLETQQCDPRPLNSTTRESHNISIHSAETQKQLPEEDINNSTKKLADVSIHSAETQKRLSEGTFNNSVQETIKLADVSIFSAETQKIASEDDSLENLETQQFSINKSDFSTRKSIDPSIYTAETQKVVPKDDVNESIENMETQQVDIRKPYIFQTPNLPKRKSIKTPLSEMETQKYDPDSSLVNDESLEDAETERFESEKSDTEKRKSEMFTPKKISVTESLHEAETQKYLPDTSINKISNGDESINDLETQQFINNNSNIVINESTDNIESQQPANSTSIEDMETMPFNEERPSLDQNNQHISENVEETNNGDIIDQPATICSEKVHSSLQETSSINNIDISRSAEHDNIEDEMFSQNLIEDCPFAFLSEESQENIDQVMDTSKISEELEQENKNNANCSISNVPVEVSDKSNSSVGKKPAPAVDNDSETDEEGIFSNSISAENNTKTNNTEKTNSDSETDEEGVFSSHMSKETENSELSVKTKDNDDTETDEGIFSNPSKSNEKITNENNETDSETDEEGIFSNSLSKASDNNETTKATLENNENVSNTGNDASNIDENNILNNSLTKTNKMREDNNKSGSERSKVQSPTMKQNSLIHHSPIPDSDSSLFDDNDDDDESNLNKSGKSNLKVEKSFNQTDSSGTNKDNQSTSNEDTKKTDSASNERSNVKGTLTENKSKNSEVDDLAPTQVLDTSKSVIEETDSEDEYLAPTQVISPKKEPKNSNDKEDDFLAPTQLIVREKSPVKEDSEKFEDLNLSPTQKIDTQDCTEILPPTENVKNSPSRENNKIDRNASVEDLDYEMAPTQVIENKIDRNTSVEDLDYEMAPTQVIEDNVSKEQLNSSKRQLEELEITCHKKLKSDEFRQVDADLDNSLEKKLNNMFDGPEEDKLINQLPELHTQQLENILQASQAEEEPAENIIVSVPSPTLSSNRKNPKAKNRRKVMQLKKTSTPSQEKKVNINLNDTIERQMNEMDEANVNDVESYESDSMMTQQLMSVLESQDNDESNVEEIKTKVSPNVSTRKSRSSLPRNENVPSTSKSKVDKRKSKSLVAQSRVTPVKEKPKSKNIEASAEESQEMQEYFANLKSKKKRVSAIIESQDSQEEQTIDNERELVYKHGILGFDPNIGPIKTSDRVPLYEPKARPYSDSQSEGEDPNSSQRRKRFSLSLSKNVDLNSSLSDRDLEKTLTEASAGKEVGKKRVLAKGTRGFHKDLPVESDELVSAPSTEGEEEIGLSEQKVGTVDSSLRLSLDVERETGMSQPVDSDEEFLRSMPDIKVAGTADCPPTNSQLAAPSDDDDDKISLVSSATIDIPAKYQLYASNRFDLVYKKLAAANDKDEPTDDEREDTEEDEAAAAPHPMLLSPQQERQAVPSSEIEAFIANLGKKRRGAVTSEGAATPSRSSRAGKRGRGRGASNLGNEVTPEAASTSRGSLSGGRGRTMSTRSSSNREVEVSSETPSTSRSSRAGRRGRSRGMPSPCTPLTRSSSNLGVEVTRSNLFAEEANKTIASSSDSDSDSTGIIPKYKAVNTASFKRQLMDMARSTADVESDDDPEFARLRETFARILSKPSTHARTAAPKSSPAGARGRRACALTGGTLSGAGSRTTTTTTRTRDKAGIADEDALVFQVPNGGGAVAGAVAGARRRPALAITRTKRTAAVEDSQNQPPKRAKIQKDSIKLQELSVVISPLRDKFILNRSQQVLRVIDNNATNAFRQNANELIKKQEKNLIKVPKTAESYVVLQRTKSKVDDLQSSKSSDKKLENKGDGEVKSTSRRNKTTKAEATIAKGLSTSKDSVVVEDSDADSSAPTSARGTRSRRNNDTNSSGAKSNSQDESSANSSSDNKSTKSTRGKGTRQTRKTAAPIKDKTIIPDSDQESDESQVSNSRKGKTVPKSDSDKSEETKKPANKSTRSRRIKDSESEKLESSKPFVNTQTRSRRIRNATASQIISSQDSDSEFSEGTKSIIKKEIKSKRNVKDKKASDSERSLALEKNSKLDIPAENKKTRNTRRAKAQNSSDSVFSESDSDRSKNLSVANTTTSSRSVRQTRKRAATVATSSESQEVAEFMASSVKKDSNATKTRSGRAAKKTNASNSSTSQNSKEDESQTDETVEKSGTKAKRARVNSSAKNSHSSPSPTPSEILSTPMRNRRSSISSPTRGSQYKVLFTGDKPEAHRHIVSKLGASESDDPAKCTILVTDKVRRTFKFLCCMARGIPIVSFNWLDDSCKARHFVDWNDYILEDPVSEAQYKFNLQKSLEKARKHKFLEGYTVLLLQVAVLKMKELKEIVISSGGKPLFRAPANWPENVVVVTTEDKLQNVKKLIAKAPRSVTIQSTEFLFTGILRQELNLQEFKLSS